MPARKKDPEPLWDYHPDAHLGAPTVAAMDKAVQLGVTTSKNGRVDRFRVKPGETALLSVEGGPMTLAARWHPEWHAGEKGAHYRARASWTPVLLFRKAAIAGQHFILAEPPPPFPFKPAERYALQKAFGRGENLSEHHDSRITAEKIEDAEAVLELRGDRIAQLWIGWHGLWGLGGRWQSGSEIRIADEGRLPGTIPLSERSMPTLLEITG